MKSPSTRLWLHGGLVYLLLYAPIAVVMFQSFNAAPRGAEWKGFTWQWYRTLGESPEKLAAVKNTLVLAGASTAFSVLLGTLLGYGLSRFDFPFKRFFSWTLYIPIVIPDIVAAVAMLIFFSLLRNVTGLFDLGLFTMTIAHITFQVPFIAVVVRSRLAGLDPAMEEAAHDLGASPGQKFRYITLPLMLPGIFAGAALAFTLSLDDFVISFFTSGPGATTLPILIYSSVKRGITPDINALSTLIVAGSVVGTLAVLSLQRLGGAPQRPR
jgi:spermidine/putrescine transport system permease protein